MSEKHLLVEYAEDELKRAGLFDTDADYDGGIAKAALAIVGVFASQGHSGGSAAQTIEIVEKLMRFRPLTPLTSNSDEWMDVSEYSSDPPGTMYQSKRCPSVFSRDGGKTWYDLDAPKIEESA